MANLQDAVQKLKHVNLTQYHENQEKSQNFEVIANDTKFKLESLAKQVQILEQNRMLAGLNAN